jgi:hypothetical protein
MGSLKSTTVKMEIITATLSRQLHNCMPEMHLLVYCFTTFYHILPIQLQKSIQVLQTIWVSSIEPRAAILNPGIDLNNILIEPRVFRVWEAHIGVEEVTGKNKLRLSIGEILRLGNLRCNLEFQSNIG